MSEVILLARLDTLLSSGTCREQDDDESIPMAHFTRVNMARIRSELEPGPSGTPFVLEAPGFGVRFDPAGGSS